MCSLPAPLVLTLLQLLVLTYASGGAYYGHNQHPQQYQPMQHLQAGFPQQQYHGKDVPYMQYPHYRKDLPQMPMLKGKEKLRKGGNYNGGQDKGKVITPWCFISASLAHSGLLAQLTGQQNMRASFMKPRQT